MRRNEIKRELGSAPRELGTAAVAQIKSELSAKRIKCESGAAPSEPGTGAVARVKSEPGAAQIKCEFGAAPSEPGDVSESTTSVESSSESDVVEPACTDQAISRRDEDPTQTLASLIPIGQQKDICAVIRAVLSVPEDATNPNQTVPANPWNDEVYEMKKRDFEKLSLHAAQVERVRLRAVQRETMRLMLHYKLSDSVALHNSCQWLIYYDDLCLVLQRRIQDCQRESEGSLREAANPSKVEMELPSSIQSGVPDVTSPDEITDPMNAFFAEYISEARGRASASGRASGTEASHEDPLAAFYAERYDQQNAARSSTDRSAENAQES